MSNKNLRVKVRIHGIVDEILDKSDACNRPGWAGRRRNIISQIPTVEIPYDEWAQRLSDAESVLEHGYVLGTDAPPTAVTDESVSVSATSESLRGTVNSQTVSTVVTFDYGLTLALGSTTTAVESPLTGAVAETVSKTATGLTAETKYYYRVKAVSATKTVYGLIKSFTTPAAP